MSAGTVSFALRLLLHLQTVFSDEKKTFRRVAVKRWRRRGQRFARRGSHGYYAPTTAKSEGVMVWLAINARGQSCRRLCMKASGYQAVLETALEFFKRRFVGIGNSTTNGAPSHTARSTKTWLHVSNVRMLHEGNWPEMSPNPVETLWPIVTRALFQGALRGGLLFKRK